MTVPAIELTLERFRKAHEESYETALAEIRSGRKKVTGSGIFSRRYRD